MRYTVIGTSTETESDRVEASSPEEAIARSRLRADEFRVLDEDGEDVTPADRREGDLVGMQWALADDAGNGAWHAVTGPGVVPPTACGAWDTEARGDGRSWTLVAVWGPSLARPVPDAASVRDYLRRCGYHAHLCAPCVVHVERKRRGA